MDSSKKKFILLEKEKWVLMLCCIAIFSLLFEKLKVVLSISMILLFVSSIVDFSSENKFYFKTSNYFRSNWKNIWQNKAFLSITLLFAIVFISGIWSEDWKYLAERLQIRLPFLILPMAFAWLPPMKKNDYYYCFYFLLVVLSCTMLAVLINYSTDFEAINKTLLHGKNIPVPQNHIRFSLITAFTILTGIILWEKKYYVKHIWEQKLIIVLVIFLFISLHILTVRSGLASLYLGILVLSIRYIWRSKRYVLIFGLIAFLFSIPLSAYFLIPSVNNKVHYALYDFEQFQKGNGSNYSDAERLGSILAGLKVGNDNFWLGCGYGDLNKEVNLAYQEVFPQEKEPKIPHNQYIMIYAGLGIIGLFAFLVLIIFPIFYKKNYQESIFLIANVISLSSFLVEATIETQAGVAFYTFFLCLGMRAKH